jgi:hypothetical protein
MLSKHSWITLSWDGQPIRRGPENARVDFSVKGDLMPFDKACDQTAHEIYALYPRIYLALSGGCDSENIANVLYRNRIPFVPIIVIYDHIVNNHQPESAYAVQWCKDHGMEPQFVSSKQYVESVEEKTTWLKVRPRLYNGLITAKLLTKFVNQRNGYLLTGNQLEYYPDHEQMTYLEPQLGAYQGFVIEESDFYIDVIGPDQHPYAFYYWSPEILAAFVNEWNTDLTMQQNKSLIYKVAHRPKMGYSTNMLSLASSGPRALIAKKFGTRDCVLMGTKQTLLDKLLK